MTKRVSTIERKTSLRREKSVADAAFFVVATTFAVVFALFVAPASAATTETDSAEAAPAFRYWKAPADAIARWPWGSEKYFPIRAETFDAWLRTTAESFSNARGGFGAANAPGIVSELRLDATLDGDSLSGFGTLELSRLSDDGANAAFPLDSFSFALSSFFEREGARNAAVALYPDSRLYVPEPKNGAYSFRWTRRGTVDSLGTISFDLEFPASPRTELRLETPLDAIVSCSNGVVAPPEETDRGTLRRRVFLGGKTQTRLTISGTATESVARRRIGFQQDASHRVSLEGVEVVSRFVFDRSEVPLDEATLVLDDPLVPISINWNGLDGAELGATQTNGLGTTKVKLRAPARNAGESLGELKVVAFYPLELDVERRLPAIQIVSDALVWKETLCRMTVVRPVLATATTPIDAVQARDPMRTPQEDQDFFLFKFFESDSGVVVKLQTPPNRPAFDSATDATIVADEIAAKTTLFFQCDESDRFRLSVPLAPNWEVDAVQTPLDSGSVWTREEKNGARSLVVSFKTPPASNRPIRVVLSARYAGRFERQIPVSALCPVDLSDALRGAHALSLRAESPNQIKLSTRSGRPFSAPKTTPNFVFGEAQIRDALSGASNVGRLYFGDQTVDAIASLENLKSNYSAELSGVGELRANAFAETWKLRCSPATGTRVDRIVFFATSADSQTVADAPWFWSTATEPDRLFAATRLSPEEATAFSLPAGVDAFEIRLSTSRSVPFDLNLYQTIPATAEISAPLVFLPEASIRSAEFVVESPFDYPFWVRPEKLEATPAPLAPPDEYEPLKSAFRYVPTLVANDVGDENAGQTPRLAVLLAPPKVDSRADGTSGSFVENVPPPATKPSGGAPSPDVLSANAWCWFETFDAFYETNGTVRRRVSFFIENRGRASLLLKTPAASADKPGATRAVWLDDRRVPWSVEKIDDQTDGVRVALPPDRRFVCVGIEYYSQEPPLGAFRRLKPAPISCDAPVLSGVWNVWTPPEYQICDRESASDRAESRAATALRAFVDFFSFQESRTTKIERVADRFLTRFGDAAALRRSVRDALADGSVEKSASSGAKFAETPSSAVGGNAAAVDASPTWGDVFGLSASLERLFAPNAPKPKGAEEPSDADQDGEIDAPVVETFDSPFGTLEKPRSPFRLYVDRFCLSRLRLTPTTPISRSGSERDDDPKRRAVRTLNDARLVLIFIDDDLALLTTNEIASDFGSEATAPISDAAIRRVKSDSEARRYRRELLANAYPRFVASSSWRAVDDEAVGPWRERPREEIAIGWNRASKSLVGAAEGIRVADRYVASTIVLFSFLAFLGIVWRSSFAKPSFFVAALGICGAARLVAPFELRLVATGASWAAVCAFGFYFVRFCAPLSPSNPNASAERRGSTRPAPANEPTPKKRDVRKDAKIVSEIAPRSATGIDGADGSVEIEVRDGFADANDDESTQGFVDLSKLPPGAFNGSGFRDDSSPPRPDRQGSISMKTIVALAATLSLVLLVAASRADDGDSPVSLATNVAKTDAAPWREPFRVFVPVDDERRTVGDFYWISEELYEKIRTTLKARPRERNWRIVDAKYEGVVNYNGVADATSLFSLKATYKIVLDAPNATIALPATQLVPDVGAKFEKQTLSPVVEDGAKEFYFEIEDAEPGERVLELTFAPPQFSETTDEISIPIPRVPTARLELSVPSDAPELDVPNAQGKVTRGAGRLVAELGSIDRLVLSKKRASGKSSGTTVDVEQLFLMRTRPTQTDVRAAFHYQVVGGKIQALQIACDPLYAFSGYCQCDQAEIESIEPPTSQNDALRVSFKRPISGSFVLNADFVARNFSGVGQIPFPQIATEQARISKNWLALAPGGGIECAKLPETTLSTTSFQNVWGAPFDETPTAVFDLSATPPGRPISLRLTPKIPRVSETTSLVFRPTQIETRLAAEIDAPTELFRLEIETPSPFVVDAVSLIDEKGAILEKPSAFLSSDGLSILFSTPLKGKYSLQIDGRTKSSLDAPLPFPSFRVKEVETIARIVRTYCDASVYLERTPPKSWVALDKARADALEATSPGPKRDGDRRVDVCEVAPTATPESPSRAAEIDEFVARVNAPQIVGRERVVLYRKPEASWKAAVDWRLLVRQGRVERFYVAADDSFSIEPLSGDSNFTLSETRLPSGVRVLVFEPKTPFARAPIDLQFVATLKNDAENVRLPRFRLLAASDREDVSGVRRFFFLPTREDATPIRWETQNLKPLSNDSSSVRDALQTATKSTVALARSGASVETTLDEEIPRDVNLDSGLTTDDFLAFEEIGETGSATLATKRDRLQVARAEHSFYWNSRQEFFGASTFAFRSNAPKECVLIVPSNYRVLEATVDGSRRRAERIDERRLRVDLDATPFAKRLEISFQGVGALDENAAPGFFGRRDAVFNAAFPRVENGEAEEIVWVCAFDALDDAAPRWQVYRRLVGERKPDRTPDRRERLQATREPLAFSEAGDVLFRLCVGKANSAFDALQSDAALFANSRPDDFARRFARWSLVWNQCADEISRFVSPDRPFGALSERQKAALYAVDGEKFDVAPRDLAPIFDRWSFERYREILEQKKNLETTYRLSNAELASESSVLSPQSVWAFNRGEKTRVLFGLSRENVERVVVVAPPKRFDFFASRWATALFFLAAVAIVLELFKTDAKSRLFKSVLFGTFGTFGALAFFAFDWKAIGWCVVAFLAVAPPALAAATRRDEERKSREIDSVGGYGDFGKLASNVDASDLSSTEAFDSTTSSGVSPSEASGSPDDAPSRAAP